MKWFLATGLAMLQTASFAAQPLPQFDFTKPEVCAGWREAHDIAALRPTPEGFELTITNLDPFITGPARDFPAGVPLRMSLRLKSDEGGHGQVFYFRDHPREEASARFSVNPGEWTTAQIFLPALGKGYRLRLDPPGTRGKAVLARIDFASSASLATPQWPKPEPVDFSNALRVQSGALEVLVAERGFRVSVGGQALAVSHSRPLIGYCSGEKLKWLDLASPPIERNRLEQTATGATTMTTLRDEEWVVWRIRETFSPALPGAVTLERSIEPDRDREVAFLPMLLLTASPGDTNKSQALFSGLEYLDNEPSSSEADIVGPESRRQVPSNHKITAPLMVIQRDARYVGLIWEHRPEFSAVFDSPDRVLGTGGHLMGILFPGSDRINRHEGSLLPTQPTLVRAGQRLTLTANLIGGTGNSVVPAIQLYAKLRGLPPAPDPGYSLGQYAALAAHGWLDSAIRHTNLFRHAVWNGFEPHAAADASVFMAWLASRTRDTALQERLRQAAAEALAPVPVAQRDFALVGHVRYPVQSLVFGGVEESAKTHRAQAQALLQRFKPDGTVRYRPQGNVDYGRTHFTNHANGLSAQVAAMLLESAVFSGDPALIERGLEVARALIRTYADTVPRGAQTWEVPLHTPDIMASAHMVRVCTLSYELTHESSFLEQARYWAWTGLPFLYLTGPTGFPDPPYGCATVYGATSWQAPVWFGRPVQWCGLVYADALYRLLPHDPDGPWKQVADGITAMGIRYSWPPEDKDRQGLLPDVWEMLSQTRSGPAINPGTVQANAIRFYGQGQLYDSRIGRVNGRVVSVHAPGEITDFSASASRLAFEVRGWPTAPYSALVNGLGSVNDIQVNGQRIALPQAGASDGVSGRLVLPLSGKSVVEIRPVVPVGN